MNSTTPALLFGFGEWQQITDRFLYCANSSKEVGGSKKITVAQLPPHSHAQNVTANNGNQGVRRDWDSDGNCTAYPQGLNTGETGGGEDYMPPYMTVYAWYRIA